MMRSPAATLALTHSAAFALGVFVGWKSNNDELNLYREAHESTLSKWKRHAVNIAIAVGAVSTMVLAVRASHRMGS